VFSYNLRFPGQYFDVETGKHYNYFRDYDPGIGRYVESDPIGLKAGSNTFGYVGGNPLRRKDSLGLITFGSGCSSAAQDALGKAEERVKKKVDESCGGCAAGNTGCIPCKYWEKVRRKLQETVVSCSSTPSPRGDCAAGDTPGSKIVFYPIGLGSTCGCLQATLLHEMFHNISLGEADHPEINYLEKRCFGTECGPLDRGYGPFTPPNDPFY
jgi:RHS repeat-associated protein